MNTEKEKAGPPLRQKSSLKGNQINWNQLFYFCEIATCGSIKEASTKLELTSPTLSAHLANLESDLDVQLFHRHHRKLVLTAQGAKLFQYAKQMFEVGQRLVDVVSPIPLGCYPISIGLVPCPSMQLAYSFVDLYLSKYAPSSLRASQSKSAELERGLVEAKFDFGFSDRMVDRPEIVSHLISSSELNLYVSSKWAGEKFSDLISRLPLLVCTTESGGRTVLERLLEETDHSPTSVISSDYPSLLFELCKKGRGIGVFGEDAVASVNQPLLKTLRIPQNAPRLKDKLYVHWSRDSENTEVIKHLKTLLPEFKNIREQGH